MPFRFVKSVDAGFSWLQPHQPRMWEALRMTASTAVTFALGSLLGMPQTFWAVIAALIVTQSSIGGSLKAALEQFIGSISGAIYGAAIALAIPHQSPLMLGLALVLAVAPLTILPTFSPGFRIAPITAIIVLLSTIGVSLGPVGFAIERVLEVGLGCAVGLAVSFLIVPARAYDAVLKTAGQTASLVADQIELLAVIWDRKRAVVEIDALPTQIRTSLATLERLADEAARERLSRLSNEPDPAPLSRTLARLQVDVSTLGRIVRKPLPEEVHRRLSGPWVQVVQAAAEILRALAQALPTRTAPKGVDALTKAIAGYEAAVDEIRQEGLTKSLPTGAVGRVFALGFVLDQFRRNLEDLVRRTAEVHGSKLH
jgi:uncharacterized membrane protein YccC